MKFHRYPDADEVTGDERDELQRAGYQAYKDGLDEKDSPHQPGTLRDYLWAMGWRAGCNSDERNMGEGETYG